MNKMKLITPFLISILITSGCFTFNENDTKLINEIIWDALTFFNVTSTIVPLNNSVVENITKDLNGIGINASSTYYEIFTIKYDDPYLINNHLGGDIHLSYSYWKGTYGWSDWDVDNETDDPLLNTIVLSNCYIANWTSNETQYSKSSNEYKNILISYNEEILSIITKYIKGDILSQTYEIRENKDK